MSSVQANGITIEFEDTGETERPAVVLIRGLGTQLIDWDASFVDALSQAELRVIRPDNRDVGLSTKFESFGVPNLPQAMAAAGGGAAPERPYALDDMAADVTGLLDALEIERAHVVGMSMGGFIVQTLAAHHADRVRSMTSIMSGSGNPALPPPTPEATAALFAQPDDPEDRESVIAHGAEVLRVLGSPAYPTDEASRRAAIAARYDRCYHPAGVARQLLAVVTAKSRVEMLKKISVPTLVIHGRADPLVSVEAGIETAELVPGARLELIDGMGHELPRALVPRLAGLIIEHTTRAG